MPLFLAPLETKIRIAKILTDEKTKHHLLSLGLCFGHYTCLKQRYSIKNNRCVERRK